MFLDKPGAWSPVRDDDPPEDNATQPTSTKAGTGRCILLLLPGILVALRRLIAEVSNNFQLNIHATCTTAIKVMLYVITD